MKINQTERLMILMDEISIAKSQLQPTDTGHIHTAINWMETRVDEVKKDIDEELKKAAYAY
tara:strand:- start:9 stop:191 length:183 start_codon:yes stop_codon:yes gene_type:complete